MVTMYVLIKYFLSFWFSNSSLRKHSNALYTVLKRVITSFSKDTGELASSFLDFMRQILNSDTLVSEYVLNTKTQLHFSETCSVRHVQEQLFQKAVDSADCWVKLFHQ